MNSIYEKIHQQIKKVVADAFLACANNKSIPQVELPEISVEVPRERGFGDFSTNIVMQVARQIKMPPRKAAELLIQAMDLTGTYIEKVECAGPGFINFYLNRHWLYDALRLIQEKKEHYGELDMGKNIRVNVEFVSANPTGPLHMGNARGGALGDCIASVLKKAGYDVTREYYINDTGNQIEKFGISLEARYLQQLLGEEKVAFPEDGYHGEDIIQHAKDYISKYGDALLEETPEKRREILAQYALPINIDRIREMLAAYGIEYDVWFSERSLHQSGEVDETIEFLTDHGYTTEKEGAIWLNGEKLGLEKDEVLVRNNGVPTYLAADIAYHRNKFVKRGFDWCINLWGADHHGHVARMKAAMAPFGVAKDKLEVVLFQLVRLYRNGEIARMSKRTGKSISLEDLLEEVGRDAARFFFNLKTSGSHLDFDLDLAVSQSNENPVYYVQYAHARICSLIRRLKEEEGVILKDTDSINPEVLTESEELDLIRKLSEYPEEVRLAAKALEPSRLTRYVMDVAANFHSFYNACRVKGVEEPLMMARLMLVDSTRIVIKNVLDLISIHAPEKM
ncbi:MAG: arginine--tRNA ligase [Clostridiaceae bacterium]|jgi:arginyl-tRNA synthetase|nr:arginine--tRNA ligase [Bacillota bacterium]NLI39164.1 arginine--tRNA ligase [Clostridiaceae bacterium]